MRSAIPPSRETASSFGEGDRLVRDGCRMSSPAAGRRRRGAGDAAASTAASARSGGSAGRSTPRARVPVALLTSTIGRSAEMSSRDARVQSAEPLGRLDGLDHHGQRLLVAVLARAESLNRGFGCGVTREVEPADALSPRRSVRQRSARAASAIGSIGGSGPQLCEGDGVANDQRRASVIRTVAVRGVATGSDGLRPATAVAVEPTCWARGGLRVKAAIVQVLIFVPGTARTSRTEPSSSRSGRRGRRWRS